MPPERWPTEGIFDGEIVKSYSTLRTVCVLAALACLILGYVELGGWLIVLTVPAAILLWAAARRRSAFWTGGALLAGYLALAAMGIALAASGLLMSTGGIFALAGWELNDPRGISTGTPLQARSDRLEQRRLRSLGIVAAISVLLAAIPSLVRLRLPFGMVALLALVAAGGVLYSVHYLRHTAGHEPPQ